MPDSHLDDPFIWLSVEEMSLDAADADVDNQFDEAAYLRAFPDISRAVQAGQWSSGRHHYGEHGSREMRLRDSRYLAACNALVVPPPASMASTVTASIDAVFVTRSGMCLIVGWANDIDSPILDVSMKDGSTTLATTHILARCRRRDAETALGCAGAHLLGFWSLVRAVAPSGLGGPVSITVRTHSGILSFDLSPSVVSDARLRELAFGYFADAEYFGNKQVESFLQLERGFGRELTAYNSEISRSIIASAEMVRFGPERTAFEGSIIVCLYGKHEFLFLQGALFSGRVKTCTYEFIYVSNSPELAEKLQREASMAARIYGVSITLVILRDNAGFGAANNVAARFARSRRIVIVNPDVFPRSENWAALHSAVIDARPSEETRIFGVPLYYDDGSLMHGGLHFEMDEGWSIRPDGIERRRLVRVEHYGKGSPATVDNIFTRPRPIPGVTGAFISVDRDWFEKLGGFSLEFVYGHYEDADLCLKSLANGQAVWMQNIPFWHMEGKGSTRLPIHEGGSLINRWYFTSRWGALLEDGLLGKQPTRLNAR